MSVTPTEYTLAALQRFLTTPLEPILARYFPLNVKHNRLFDSDISRYAAERALGLFQSAVKFVPAYRAFLAEQNIIPDSVQTLADFQELPQGRRI